MTDANEPEKKIQTGPKVIHSNPVICLLLIPFCSLLTCHLFIVASRHLEYIYYFVFACFVMIAVIILEQLLASGYFRYKKTVLSGILVLTVVTTIIEIPLTVPFLMPWTELNCYHLRIDINSGRLRSEQYLYYKLIRSKEETTALSKVLYPDGNYPPPEWHCVITFDPYINNSPHYRFHGAANQIKKFDFITKNMSEVERLAVAHKIVAIWQKEKNYHAVNTYLEGIWQEQLERDSKKR